ncbi:hypothetical protein C0992_000196 [Termitomyces sp. T32_za158]|nr:hypothetical protein C0992_000196 [Termitomyces sp. T32_za158]
MRHLLHVCKHEQIESSTAAPPAHSSPVVPLALACPPGHRVVEPLTSLHPPTPNLPVQLTVVAHPSAPPRLDLREGRDVVDPLWLGACAGSLVLRLPMPALSAVPPGLALSQRSCPPTVALPLGEPFTLHLAAGSRTLSQVSAPGAQVPLLKRAPSILLHDSPADSPPEAANHLAHVFHELPLEVGRMLLAADKVFPHKVIHVLEGGMLEFIPLNLLTDKACCVATHKPPPPESDFVISNSKLRLPVASFDTSKEDKLSFDEWCGTSDNLVEAMHKHLHAGEELQSSGHIVNVIADPFARHFKYLKNMNNACLLFPVVLHYDCHLQGLFLLTPSAWILSRTTSGTSVCLIFTLHVSRL